MGLAPEQKRVCVVVTVTVPTVSRLCPSEFVVFGERRPQGPPPEGIVLTAGAVCGGRRCRVERPLSAEVQVWLSSESTETRETVSELGGHEIVEDRVDGGVDVGHDTTEVEQVVVDLDVEGEDGLFWRHDDPECKGAERHQAYEEREYHGSKHHHHLFPVPVHFVLGRACAVVAVAVTRVTQATE